MSPCRLYPAPTFLAAIAALLIVEAPSVAHANGIAIPPAAPSVAVNASNSQTNQSFTGPGNLMASVFGADAIGSIGVGPTPNVQVSGFGSPGADFDASSILTYYFEIAGPSASSIPVTFFASGTTSGVAGNIGAAFVVSSVLIGGFPNHTTLLLAQAQGAGSPGAPGPGLCNPTVNCPAFNVIQTVDLGTGNLYSIRAAATVNGGGAGSGASASVDPYFFIDPSFPNAGAYSISLSTGIGNSPPVGTAVPEPSSLSLMGLGLTGLAGAWLRRKSHVAMMKT